MSTIDNRWYWDRRTRKAVYPIERDDDSNTQTFVSVWHREEVKDAIDGEALVPIEDVSSDMVDTTFDLLDSFRMPDLEELDE